MLDHAWGQLLSKVGWLTDLSKHVKCVSLKAAGGAELQLNAWLVMHHTDRIAPLSQCAGCHPASKQVLTPCSKHTLHIRYYETQMCTRTHSHAHADERYIAPTSYYDLLITKHQPSQQNILLLHRPILATCDISIKCFFFLFFILCTVTEFLLRTGFVNKKECAWWDAMSVNISCVSPPVKWPQGVDVMLLWKSSCVEVWSADSSQLCLKIK